MHTQTSNLNDADLEAATGGMSCDTAKSLATLYNCVAITCHAVGWHLEGAHWHGKADGIQQGACPA
jgi:hypothetical protein